MEKARLRLRLVDHHEDVRQLLRNLVEDAHAHDLPGLAAPKTRWDRPTYCQHMAWVKIKPENRRFESRFPLKKGNPFWGHPILTTAIFLG